MTRTLFVLILLFLVACTTTTPPQQNNQTPVATFTATTSGMTATFDATASTDSDGTIVNHLWDFGDGSSGSGPQIDHDYGSAGTYTVTLTVTDDDGATSQASRDIAVAEPNGPGAGSISGSVSMGASVQSASRQLHHIERAIGDETLAPDFAVGSDLWTLRLATAPNLVPGEILIRFADGVRSQAQIQLSVAGTTFRPTRRLGLQNTVLYRAEAIGEVETLVLARTLSARPDVLYAIPNFLYRPLAVPNDEYYKFQWHYPGINLPQAWDLTKGSADTVVAVIDTGIVAHPELNGRLVPGFDFVSDPNNAGDGDGRDSDPTDPGPGSSTGYHGTHVSGTIAANSNDGTGVAGVDWNAMILPVRVLGLGGGNLADIIDGILWSVDVHPTLNNPNPADVLNLSLGATGPCNALEQDAIDQAIASGAIVVVAAGNEDQDAGFAHPANCNGAIAVGATDFAGARAPYSNWGSRIDVMAPGGNVQADLNQDGFADGVLSLSFDDNTNDFFFIFENGTSMAAPHVAGVASLMKAIRPDITQTEVLNALASTARPLNGDACNGGNRSDLTGNDCGAGLIDALAALQAIDPTTPPPPPPSAGLGFDPTHLDFGTQLETMELTLTNGGATPLSWSASQFFPDDDNPGDVLDFGVSLSVLSGDIAAGGSQTVTVGVDRSKATANGTYSLEIEFETTAGPERLPLSFTKGDAPQPPAADLSGTVVLVCFVVGDTCDDERSSLVETSGGGATVSYVAPDLAEGAYLLIGWKDSNGNDDVDDGDLFGFYSVDAFGATEVSPPATDIDFLVAPVGSDLGIKVEALLIGGLASRR